MASNTFLLVLLMCGVSEKGGVDIARYYAARGKLVDVNEYYDGFNALTWVSRCGYLDIVEALLAAGADTKNADEGGYTALIWAAVSGHIEVGERKSRRDGGRKRHNHQGPPVTSASWEAKVIDQTVHKVSRRDEGLE